jgi:predicted porin
MNRSYLLAAAIGAASIATLANAADPLPDSLSLGGITIYGTVDIGYAYQSHGVPLNSTFPGGLEYQAFTTTRNFAGSVSTVAESGLEQSKIGIRVQQVVTGDLSIVARAETGFNPLSGHLTDACESIASNSGAPTIHGQGNQTANADSSRCGQAFNSVLYGGVSTPELGQLTVGRHNSLQLDALAQFDPQTLSYAFSFLGYSGFNGGAGSTQAARWDNSVRYGFTNPMFHFAAMYSNGGADAGILGKSYGFDVGLTLEGLALEGVYQNEKGAVNLRSSFDDTSPAPVPTPGLAAYISNDTSYNLMGKYTVELGDGSSKDKFTVYAGYSHIQKANSNYTSGNAQGDYPLDIAIFIGNSAVYNMEWIGARYAMSTGLNLIGAYYHITQNSWTIGVYQTPPTPNVTGVGCSAAGLLCAGSFNEASAVLDYVFNKHYDAYGGINYSMVKDGLANGFVGTTVGTSGSENQTTFMVGFRVKF